MRWFTFRREEPRRSAGIEPGAAAVRRLCVLPGQEDTPKVVCVYGDELPDIPTETRCRVRGRVIAFRYVTVGYDINMKPADV